jgi:hypothetical protein
MELKVGSQDHMHNEFFSYRYSTRFQKGELVEIKVGIDLECARFQARKSFPEVLNEYWWLKPSDVPALKNIPLKVSDIFFYHGGIPVLVLVTASGTLTRKAQVFIKKKEERKPSIEPETLKQIELLEAEDLSKLLHDQNLLIRLKAVEILADKFPDFSPTDFDLQIILKILKGNFDDLIAFGKNAIDDLVERFFVTTNAKEIERILDTIIAIGSPALPKLEGVSDFLSILASPYYAKRINWTIEQINKKTKKKSAQKRSH